YDLNDKSALDDTPEQRERTYAGQKGLRSPTLQKLRHRFWRHCHQLGFLDKSLMSAHGNSPSPSQRCSGTALGTTLQLSGCSFTGLSSAKREMRGRRQQIVDTLEHRPPGRTNRVVSGSRG